MDGVEKELIHLKDYQSVLYGIDEEKENGFPEASKSLLKQIQSADAFIISTAEHNSSLPVALKNALDWLSRMERNVFEDKPMLILSTSPGRRGGKTALSHLEMMMPRFGAKLIGSLSIPEFNQKVQSRIIVDKEIKEQLIKEIESLLTELK